MMRKRVTMLILAAVTAFCCLGLVACGEKKISVTFHGATDKVVEAVAGKEIELPAAPGKAGYTFGGWFADKNLSNPFDEKKGYEEDIEVWAKFTPNTNTAYKVEHYTEKLDGNYEVNSTDNLTGTTDTSATATAKTIEHFTYDPDAEDAVSSGKIAGDGSLVLKLYYTRNSYTVTYKNGAEDFATETVKYQGNAAKVGDVPTKAGYTFSGWKNSDGSAFDGQNITANTTVTGTMTANTDTAYKVEHYTEKLDGTYEVNATENLTGTTDTSATAQAKTIEHFTYDPDADGAVLSGSIAGDGSLVLKLYYTRNSYAVTFKNGSATLSTRNFRYGETPVYAGETPVKDAAGKMFYAFKGWDRAFAPVDSACEYAAAFYEIPSFESWYYCEQTAVALPDLTSFFPGATLKHFVNDIEIDPANATMQVGTQEWKVEVYVGESKLSEMTQRFEVLSAADYARRFADGSSEQYIERFLHEGYTAFTYNETENAYEFKTVDSINTWNARLQPKDDLVSDGTWKLTNWFRLSFEVKLGEDFAGTFAPNYGLSGNTTGNPSAMFGFDVFDKDGTAVNPADMVKGEWYRFSANLKFVAPGSSLYLYLFTDSNSGTMYLKKFAFADAAESDVDFFIPISKTATFTSGETVGDRTDVSKFTASAGAWDSRWQFTHKSMNDWNALAEGGGEMRFDAYFTQDVFIQFWFIPASGDMGDFTTNSASVTFFDTEGQPVTSENRVKDTWYTVVIDIAQIGAFGINNTDIGLQFAVDTQSFYMDNVEFRAAVQA